MASRPGRPKKQDRLEESMEVRLASAEKRAFKEAAGLAGIPLSTWVRERLRQVAIRELEAVGLAISFLEPPNMKEE